MKHSVMDLRAAYTALVEWNTYSKPSRDDSGRNQPPVISPLPVHLGFRLALCRNSLQKKVIEAIDEPLQALQEKYRELLEERKKTDPNATLTPEEQGEYNKELVALSREEVEWSPPATIELRALGDRALPEEWVAALLAVGILVDSPK